jgi:hypothetical protein
LAGEALYVQTRGTRCTRPASLGKFSKKVRNALKTRAFLKRPPKPIFYLMPSLC